MLTQNQSEENNPSPAAQVRVTTEELTRALAAIEARKEEESRRLEGTILIGQAVAELSLDVSAEELSAEVEAQRGAKPPSAPEPTQEPDEVDLQVSKIEKRGRRQTALSRKKTIGLAVTAAAIIFAIGVARFHQTDQTPAQAMTASGVMSLTYIPSAATQKNDPLSDQAGATETQFVDPDKDFYDDLAQCSGPHPRYHLVRVAVYGVPSWHWQSDSPPEKIYPISAVPDGFSIFAFEPSPMESTKDLSLMGYGVVVRPVSAQIGDPSNRGQRVDILTRYRNRLYRRGWIRSQDVAALKRGKDVSLYANDYILGVAGDPLIPVTVADEFCRSFPRPAFQTILAGASEAHSVVHNAILDAYAWQDFPNLSLPLFHPPAWAMQPDAFPSPGHLMFPPPNPLSLSYFDISAQVHPFSEVAEDQTVRCSYITLSQFLHTFPSPNNDALGSIPVDTRLPLDQPWEIIKHGGRPYLRGWIKARVTQGQLKGRFLIIASRSTDPQFLRPPVPITISLDRVSCQPLVPHSQTARRDVMLWPVERLQVSHIHLDVHAWEAWRHP